MQGLTLNENQNLTAILKNWIENENDLKNEILNNPKALTEILKMNLLDELKAKINHDKTMLKYNYVDLKEKFLSKFESDKTRRTYKNAFSDFEKYCNERKLNYLDMSFMIVDNWIDTQRDKNKSSSVIHRNIVTMSGFFKYVEYITNGGIKNFFRGIKQPKRQNVKKNHFYDFVTNNEKLEDVKKDIMKIIDTIKNKELKTIIYILAFRGLRVGAIQNLQVHNNIFKTVSKGNEIKGEFNDNIINFMKINGIGKNRPFENWNSDKISNLFKYYSKKLYKNKEISFVYSCHDLRHFYAMTQYFNTKDIYKVSKLLNHSCISVTEIYLKGLKIDL